MSDYVFVFTRTYSCVECPQKIIYSYDPKVLFKLPAEVQNAFPFVFSYKSGVEISIVQRMVSLLECAVGVKTFRNTLKEQYYLKHTQNELAYYSCLASLKKRQSIQTGVGETAITVQNTSKFSEFGDPNAYSGKVPSGSLF